MGTFVSLHHPPVRLHQCKISSNTLPYRRVEKKKVLVITTVLELARNIGTQLINLLFYFIFFLSRLLELL